jgi:hypothetical protein
MVSEWRYAKSCISTLALPWCVRDVDYRQAGLTYQLFGVVNAMLNQPLVSAGAEKGFERAGEVADGTSAFGCNVESRIRPCMFL